MFQITFLGTSASAPSIHRGLSSHVIQHNEHRFLVDCGEGTQRQILMSGLGFKRLNKVLITHGHLDHILGLGGLMSTFLRWEAIENLDIFAGRWAMQRISDLLYAVVLRGKEAPMPLNLYEISAGPIFEESDFTVSAFPVSHRGADCYGFLFQEHARRPFLPEKAEALGIPSGPWRRDLVNGLPGVLPDGRVIQPDEVLGESRPGTRLVHVGDVGKTEELVDICQGADALVIEATYLDEDAAMADEFGHLTARRAAELAARAGVHQLILTHISRRYRERDVIAEAQRYFPTALVARDFDTFQIRRGECLKVKLNPEES